MTLRNGGWEACTKQLVGNHRVCCYHESKRFLGRSCLGDKTVNIIQRSGIVQTQVYGSVVGSLRRQRFLVFPYSYMQTGGELRTAMSISGIVANYTTQNPPNVKTGTPEEPEEEVLEESIDIDDIQSEGTENHIIESETMSKIHEIGASSFDTANSRECFSSAAISSSLTTHKTKNNIPMNIGGSRNFRHSQGSSSEYFFRIQHTRALLFSALCRGNQLIQGKNGKTNPSAPAVSMLARLAFFSTNFFSFSSGLGCKKYLSFLPPHDNDEGCEGVSTTSTMFLTARTSKCLRQLLLEGRQCQSERPFSSEENKDAIVDTGRSTQWKMFGSVFTATLRFVQDLPSHVPITLYLREGEPKQSSWSSSTALFTAFSVHVPRMVEYGLSSSALFEQPHFRVCASHYSLTGALQGLSYSPFMQARLAQQLTPLEWLRDSFRRLCENNKEEYHPLSKERGENEQTDQDWVNAFISEWEKIMKDELPQSSQIHQYLRRSVEDGRIAYLREDMYRCPLLTVLKTVVLQLHLLSSLEKSLMSHVSNSENNRHHQRGGRLLRALLSQVVLRETYVITVLPPAGSVFDTKNQNGEVESKWFSALRVKKVKGLPALLRLAIPEIGRRCELFEQYRRSSPTSPQFTTEAPLGMPLNVQERETRQMREYLISLLYELGALFPVLAHIEVEEGMGAGPLKTTSNTGVDQNSAVKSGDDNDEEVDWNGRSDSREPRENLIPTAGLEVIQALDEAWSVSERMIETDGAESPMALWWLQAVAPLIHSFASLVERHQLQENLGVYRRLVCTSGYSPASVRMADMLYLLSIGRMRQKGNEALHSGNDNDLSGEEWLVEQRVAVMLFELGWIMHRLIRYDCSSYERQLKDSAPKTSVGRTSSLGSVNENTINTKEISKENQINDHKQDDQNSEEPESEQIDDSTVLPLPLAALRPSRNGREGRKRSLFYTASARGGGSSLLHLEDLHDKEDEQMSILNNNDDIRLLRNSKRSKTSRFFHRRNSDKGEDTDYYCLSDGEKQNNLHSQNVKNGKAKRGVDHSRCPDFNTSSLLFRIFGLLSETTSTTLKRKYALDTPQREGVLEDAWVGLLLGVHRLSSTLRRHAAEPSVEKDSQKISNHRKTTKKTVSPEELKPPKTSIIIAVAFAALPLSFFEAAHRLSLSISNLLLEVEARGSDQEGIGDALMSRLSSSLSEEKGSVETVKRSDASEGRAGGVGGGSSSWATPARRRECRRQRAFLHMTLQVGLELFFHQSNRAQHLLELWKLRHFGHCTTAPSLPPSLADRAVLSSVESDVIMGSVGSSLAVHAMRDYQWASTTRNLASMLIQQNTDPQGGEGNKPLEDSEREEQEVRAIVAISKNTLECLGHVSTNFNSVVNVNNIVSLGSRFKSPFAKQALVHLLLTQLKQLSQVISRRQRRKSKSDVQNVSLELFSALLDVLTRDPELLLLCGSSPAFLDELCEIHLRLGLDRNTLLAFGDSVLLPTLLPLIVKALDVSAEMGRHQVSLQTPGKLHSNTPSGAQKTSFSFVPLQHAEDCECMLFLLAELSRFAVTPEYLSSVLRHRWNDVLLRVSVYCLQNTFRGGIKQPRFPNDMRGVSLSSIVSLVTVMTMEEQESIVSMEEEARTRGGKIGTLNPPSTTLVYHTLSSVFGYNDDEITVFSDTQQQKTHRADMTTEGTNVAEGLLAISLFRVGELHNGLVLRSRLSELVGQGWNAGSLIHGEGLSTHLTAAAVTGLRAFYHAATVEPGFSFRGVKGALQSHRCNDCSEPQNEISGASTLHTNNAEGNRKLLWRDKLVLAHQEALQQWCHATNDVRRITAEQRPFFAERGLQAYVMGYLIRFMEHYLRETERRATAIATYTRNNSESEGKGENYPSTLTSASTEKVNNTMLVSLQDTPAVLLEFIGFLTAGGGWAMVYWTLNAADIAMRIVKGQTYASKHSGSAPSTEKEVRQIALSTVLSQLKAIPAPLHATGVGGIRRKTRYMTLLPTNFSKCCSALSDVLADESADTLLELPRRSKLSGLLARPTSTEECRVIMYAIKQAVIHLSPAVVPFTRLSLARDRLSQPERTPRDERGAENDSKTEGDLLADGNTTAEVSQDELDCMYFSLSAIEAGGMTKVIDGGPPSSKKTETELSTLNIGHKYYSQPARGVAPTPKDFRQLLISLMCSLDAALQWVTQQRLYRRVVDAQVRLVASKSLSCIIEDYLVEILKGSVEAADFGVNNNRLLDDHAVLLWTGLCAAAMIGRVIELLDSNLDSELRSTLHSSLQCLLTSLKSLINVISSSVSSDFDAKFNNLKDIKRARDENGSKPDHTGVLWADVYRRGIRLMQRDPEISRRCLLRLGVDTFFTALSSGGSKPMVGKEDGVQPSLSDGSPSISDPPVITTTSLARRGRGVEDPPVDLLTLMQALWVLCPASVLHPSTAVFFYDYVWLPLQRGTTIVSQTSIGASGFIVTNRTLFRETLERFGTLSHTHRISAETGDTVVRWECNIELWMKIVKEGLVTDSESEEISIPITEQKTHQLVEQQSLQQEEEEWLLSHHENVVTANSSGAVGAQDPIPTHWSSVLHHASQNRSSFLNTNLMEETQDGDYEEDLSTGAVSVSQLSLEHVDAVDMQGRELQQLHRKQIEEGGIDWMRKESEVSGMTRLFINSGILFLSNVYMLLSRFSLGSLLVVDPKQRHARLAERLIREGLHHLRLPPLRDNSMESSRIISTAVFLHNLLSSIPPVLGTERRKLEVLLTDVWVLLDSKWKAELIEPDSAFFHATRSALLRRESAFRVSDGFGDDERRSSSPLAKKTDFLSGSNRGFAGRRLKDLFTLHPEDIGQLLRGSDTVAVSPDAVMSGKSSSPILLSSAGFRVTSGLISADVVAFPRHDDIRHVVVAETHRTAKGKVGTNSMHDLHEKRVAHSVALTACLRPAMRPSDHGIDGSDLEKRLPLFVLLPLLKTLTYVRRGGGQSNANSSVSSALTQFVESIVTYACRRYILLRPRLDGNNVNVSWALWGDSGTTQKDAVCREIAYRCAELPPLSLQLSSILHKDGASDFSLFPPRISRMVKSLLLIGMTHCSTVDSLESEWVYDYFRDNALYLQCVTSIIAVICHFCLFEMKAELASKGIQGDDCPREENMLPSYLEQTLLHWLNVSSNYIRHVDTLCHLVMDLGGMGQPPQKQPPLAQDNKSTQGLPESFQSMRERKLFLERLMFVEEMRQLTSSVVRNTLLPVISATDQYSRSIPALQHAIHNLFSGFSCDSLLQQLKRSQQSPSLSERGQQDQSPVIRHLSWLRNEPIWGGKIGHYTSGSPTLMEVLSSASFIDQITPFLRVLSTHSCANCIASALSASICNPLMETQLHNQHTPPNGTCSSDNTGYGTPLLAPLLRSITTLVGGSSYPSWAARYTSVRLLCQTFARQLVARSEFRQALQPYSPLAGVGETGAAGAVPNDVLLSFLAVISRADVQVPPQALTALLELAMSLRPDVFGQPPVPTRHYRPTGYHSSTRKKGDQDSSSSVEELIQMVASTKRRERKQDDLLVGFGEEEMAILHNFTAEQKGNATASHANTLAHLHLSLPAMMELGLHLDSMRRLSSEEHRRAVGAIKAADEARRERVASVLFPPSTHSARTVDETGKEQFLSSDRIAKLAEAARLDVSAELERDDLNARLGVALLHLRFALRKVLHRSVRQAAPCLPPPLLADVVELIGTIEGGVEAVEVASTPGLSAGHSLCSSHAFPLLGRTITFSQRANGVVKWWQPPVTSSSDQMRRRQPSGDSMVSGTVRLLLAQAVKTTERLESECLSSVVVEDGGKCCFSLPWNKDTAVMIAAGEGNDFALTSRGRQRIAHIMSVLRRRRRMMMLTKLNSSTRF